MDFIVNIRSKINRTNCVMYATKLEALEKAQEITLNVKTNLDAGDIDYTVVYLPLFNSYTPVFNATKFEADYSFDLTDALRISGFHSF